MNSKLRALVVDDDAALRFTVRSLLEELELDIAEAEDGVEALEKLSAGGFQLVVTDLHMPHMDGLELLKKIMRLPAPQPKVVMMTAHGSERHAVDAIKLGAFDYFKKPFDLDEMTAVATRAIESARLTAEVERLQSERSLGQSLLFTAPVMSRLAVLVQRIAPRDVTVLLNGESGTGKERIAEAIVNASLRKDRPFVRFNCAALTAELAEAELFGHSKGAFTGAVKARLGLFREAEGGTILLDEIGELPAMIQAKLLRVLQESEVRPVGEDQPVKIDVRIIAATHRDLMQMVEAGTFREDLYYRLKVVQLQVPPLRERLEDISYLARHFLGEYSRRFAVGPFKVTPSLLDKLNAYSWPGNVRELENAIESLVALSHGNELDLSLLPEPRETRTTVARVAPTSGPPMTDAAPADVETVGVQDIKARMDAYERGMVVAALEAHRGNRSHAAKALGINRATLHGKLRKFGLSASDTELDE